jgi:hypothetical protein
VIRNVVVSVLTLVSLLFSNNTAASSLESKYHSSDEMGFYLFELARDYPDFVEVKSVAKSLEGRDVWMIEVGRGKEADRAARPAMLVVAGLEGSHLLGTELLLAFLDHLTLLGEPMPVGAGLFSENIELERLLGSVTIYLFPRLNPDGAERYFMSPKMEQPSNMRPTDDDHDGMIDEDGPDDLSGDGIITWVRVADSEGEYIQAAKDARVMRKAKREKGERGAWRYFIEGNDNDADEEFNEDGPGGVNFNMNFPFNYKFFDPASGTHQVCEPETRALADFVVAHPNIGIIFTFSMADNLLKAPEAGKDDSADGGRKRQRKPVTKVNEKDLPYYKQLGEGYRETLGLSKELTGAKVDGSFADWMYFHRGRMSLATTGWSPAMQLALEKEKKKAVSDQEDEERQGEEEKEKEKSSEEDEEEEDKKVKLEREFLEWIEENYPGGFVEWTAIEHPDFEGQKAEVGGFAPYIKTNPPPFLLEELGNKHAAFLTDLAGKLPRVAFRKLEATDLGGGVFELEVEIENSGYLPTVLAHGTVTREVVPTRVELDVPPEQILAGDRIARIDPIDGSGAVQKVRWIVRSPRERQVIVRVVSALGGRIEQAVILRD